jgi:hypothetical protein
MTNRNDFFDELLRKTWYISGLGNDLGISQSFWRKLGHVLTLCCTIPAKNTSLKQFSVIQVAWSFSTLPPHHCLIPQGLRKNLLKEFKSFKKGFQTYITIYHISSPVCIVSISHPSSSWKPV